MNSLVRPHALWSIVVVNNKAFCKATQRVVDRTRQLGKCIPNQTCLFYLPPYTTATCSRAHGATVLWMQKETDRKAQWVVLSTWVSGVRKCSHPRPVPRRPCRCLFHTRPPTGPPFLSFQVPKHLPEIHKLLPTNLVRSSPQCGLPSIKKKKRP